MTKYIRKMKIEVDKWYNFVLPHAIFNWCHNYYIAHKLFYLWIANSKDLSKPNFNFKNKCNSTLFNFIYFCENSGENWFLLILVLSHMSNMHDEHICGTTLCWTILVLTELSTQLTSFFFKTNYIRYVWSLNILLKKIEKFHRFS